MYTIMDDAALGVSRLFRWAVRPNEKDEPGEDGALAGRGLEIAWAADPVEMFFLQIQGSGRIRLQDGQFLRVGYGGANGQPYRSVGVELVRRGIYPLHKVSAQVISAYFNVAPKTL